MAPPVPARDARATPRHCKRSERPEFLRGITVSLGHLRGDPAEGPIRCLPTTALIACRNQIAHLPSMWDAASEGVRPVVAGELSGRAPLTRPDLHSALGTARSWGGRVGPPG